jgi:predicted benzoate:H+ symporter BenE
MINTLISGLVSALFEVFFEGTGRLLFGLFGKKPHRIAMALTGMAFWFAVGIALYKAFH